MLFMNVPSSSSIKQRPQQSESVLMVSFVPQETLLGMFLYGSSMLR